MIKSSYYWQTAEEKNTTQTLIKNRYTGITNYNNTYLGGISLSGAQSSVYEPYAKRIIVVGGNSSTNAACTTENLRNWTSRTLGSYYFRGVATSSTESSLGVAVAVGDSGKIYRSTDSGATWSACTTPISTSLYSVIWSSRLNMFIAVGGSGKILTSDSTGTTWTSRGSLTNNLIDIAESKTALVAIQQDGVNRAFYSTNGTSWSQITVTANVWTGITYSSKYEIFLATSISGTNRAMVSSDGQTWTDQGGAAANNANITWISQLGLFLGHANSSFDGVNWFPNAQNHASLNGVHCSFHPTYGTIICPNAQSGQISGRGDNNGTYTPNSGLM
jgi:hypothetical protein